MKKQIILPLSLLLSFVAVKASEVPAEEPTPLVESSAEVSVVAENQPAPAAEVSAPVEVAAPVVQEVTPVVVAPAVQPAPVTAVQALPTEADINNLLGLVNAYNQQASVLKSLHDLASNETTVPNLPNEESVRSLLHLLELHKKEADLITSLRASLASIQAALGQWDADVASLVTKHKKSMAKQKVAKRSLDFGAIKDLNKPRGNK